MNRTTLSGFAIAATLATLATSAQVASAATTAKASPAHVAANQRPSAKLPAVSPAIKGYTQVTSGLLNDPANSQVEGSVACPSGTLVVGGGGVVSSTSLSENLNSSGPFLDGSGWFVYLNNASGTAGTFVVYANCAKKISSYAVVSSTGIDNPAGTQTAATVACPHGTAPLGGGGFASSGSTVVGLNSSIPLKKGWRADVNNPTAGDNTAVAYAVCGAKPTLYAQVAGTSVDNPSGAQTESVAACPSGTVDFGGGEFSSSGSPLVDLNSSVPSSSAGWASYEDNNSTGDASTTAYVVCAKAKS